MGNSAQCRCCSSVERENEATAGHTPPEAIHANEESSVYDKYLGVMKGSDAPGWYKVTVRSLCVEPTQDLVADPSQLPRISEGTSVQVLHVVSHQKRIRARICKPPGWISLVDGTSGHRFAERARRPPSMGGFVVPTENGTLPCSWKKESSSSDQFGLRPRFVPMPSNIKAIGFSGVKAPQEQDDAVIQPRSRCMDATEGKRPVLRLRVLALFIWCAMVMKKAQCNRLRRIVLALEGAASCVVYQNAAAAKCLEWAVAKLRMGKGETRIQYLYQTLAKVHVRYDARYCKLHYEYVASLFPNNGFQCIVTATGTVETVPPWGWGITIAEVEAFWSWCQKHPRWTQGMSVRQLVGDIIKSEYQDGQSVALRGKLVPTRIRWLVSHCWDEEADEFFGDLVKLLSTLAEPRDGVFVCFLSLYQGTDADICSQVTQECDSIDDGCFARVLESVKLHDGAVCVIPNEKMRSRGEGIYSRLWCGWEAYQAKEQNVKILIHPDKCGQDYLFGARGVAGYTLRNGACGNPNDPRVVDKQNENQIRNAIVSRLGWDGVDARIKIAMVRACDSPCDVVPFLEDVDSVFEAALLRLEDFEEGLDPYCPDVLRHFDRSPENVLRCLVKMGSAGRSAVTELALADCSNFLAEAMGLEEVIDFALNSTILGVQKDL